MDALTTGADHLHRREGQVPPSLGKTSAPTFCQDFTKTLPIPLRLTLSARRRSWPKLVESQGFRPLEREGRRRGEGSRVDSDLQL